MSSSRGGHFNNLETAYAKGLPLVAVAPASVIDASRGHIVYVLVRNGVAITTPKDLEGKTIGSSPLRSIGELATDLWVDKNGGDSNKIKYLELPFPAVPAALEQGRIDGAIIVEPFATLSKPYAHVIGPDPMTVVGDGWLGNAYVTTKAWAAAHPDLIAHFVTAIHDTADWANKNPDQTAVILSKYTKAPVATIQSGARARFGLQLTPAIIQPSIDLMVRYKQIDKRYLADEIIYQAPK